ncbi:MAG: hypothetical protein IKZ69_00295 [Lachnospiraceae bacterium]|nr:hypothetical protein [Lachnospiraceae bacterium]MBR4812324.1 hypothetical protein [Lachnospiraceae bacterium]
MDLTSTLLNAAVSAVQKLTGSKAVIGIIVKGKITEQIPVQFNPSEYRITETSSYSQTERRGKDEPVVNYNGSQFSRLSVKLYFNGDDFFSAQSALDTASSLITGEEKEGISATIEKITALTKIDGESHQPPQIVFAWGYLCFVGFAQNVSVTYTMFDKGGKPLRAVIDFSMCGSNIPLSERGEPKESPDRTKARTLTEDTNIWSIAKNEYGNAREWRRIAEANDIMNPLDIPVGKVLRVPSIDD